MKNKNTNYGCLWVFIAVVVFWIIAIASQNVKADAYDEPTIPDIHRTTELKPIEPCLNQCWKQLESLKCKEQQPKKVPEPMPLMLIGIGAISLVLRTKAKEIKNIIEFLWLFRSAWIEKFQVFIAFLFIAGVLAWALTGCAIGKGGDVAGIGEAVYTYKHVSKFGTCELKITSGRDINGGVVEIGEDCAIKTGAASTRGAEASLNTIDNGITLSRELASKIP